MQLNSKTITWIIVGFVWSIFMGITAISIGFGALYPPMNYIAKPFVCANGQFDYVQTVSNPLPGTTYTQAGWYCTDPTTGVKTALAIFPMSLYSGAIYGALLFLVIFFFWFVNATWGSIPLVGTGLRWLGIGAIIVGVGGLTLWNLVPAIGSMFVPPSPPSIPGDASSTDSGAPAPVISQPGITPELSFGGAGTGPGQFTDVRGLGVNPTTGAIFTADYEDGRVQAFDPTGKYLSQWLVGGGGKNVIITGMTADKSGNVYIATGGKILHYDATGKLKGTLTAGQAILNNMVLGADGNLVVSADEETILRMSTSGKVLSTITKAFTGNGGDTELNVYVSSDKAGDIYALGTFNNAVFKFSPKGKFIKSFGKEGDAQGQFRAPECIAVDNQGRVYVGDIQGIQVFDSNGNFLNLISVAGAARYIVFDDQNKMYVTTSQNHVLKISVP